MSDEHHIPEGADTRTRLVLTAMRLFQEVGYEATGVARILKEANARSGSLYHFFPTKEALLLAVLEEYERMLWPIVIQPVFDRVEDPIERVFAVLEGYRQMLIETECAGGCPIGNLALELADSHPAVREKIAANFTAWMAAVRTCLDDAADRLPPDTDTDTLATFVLTTMEGAVMLARSYGKLEPFEAAVAHLRHYFDGLTAGPSQGSQEG